MLRVRRRQRAFKAAADLGGKINRAFEPVFMLDAVLSDDDIQTLRAGVENGRVGELNPIECAHLIGQDRP